MFRTRCTADSNPGRRWPAYRSRITSLCEIRQAAERPTPDELRTRLRSRAETACCAAIKVSVRVASARNVSEVWNFASSKLFPPRDPRHSSTRRSPRYSRHRCGSSWAPPEARSPGRVAEGAGLRLSAANDHNPISGGRHGHGRIPSPLRFPRLHRPATFRTRGLGPSRRQARHPGQLARPAASSIAATGVCAPQ